VALALIAATVALGLHYQGTQAATSTTVTLNGYKINTAGSTIGTFSTAKITVKKVTTGAINTSTAQPFNFGALPATGGTAGDHYIVSISPTAVTGYTIKGLTWCENACTGYIPLSTNFRAGSSTDFTFHVGNNYYMRWIYQPAAIPTPTPTPVKTPTPVPITPKPTPVPTRAPTPRSGTPVPTPVSTPGSATPAPTPTPAPVPLGVPSDFTVTSLDTEAVVSLQWTAATGPVKSYTIERSIDQVKWQVLTDSVTEPLYLDENAGFGIHYYYRLKAVGQDGTASAYVTADVSTPEFAANTDSSRDTTFTSGDQIAEVTISAGAISDQADCSVSDSTDVVSLAKGQTKVAGPYQLFCKTRLGEIINAFTKPVVWKYHLKGHLASGQVPKGFVLMPNGDKKAVSGATYDKTSQDFSFATTDTGKTLVLAASAPAPWMLYGLIGLIILLVGLGIGTLFFIRRPVKQSYEDYIRSKYYDL